MKTITLKDVFRLQSGEIVAFTIEVEVATGGVNHRIAHYEWAGDYDNKKPTAEVALNPSGFRDAYDFVRANAPERVR